MRRAAWLLLLVFAFTIPWEYSLDLGAPLGNIARIAGLIALVVFVPAVLQAGRIRVFGTLQWLVLALFLWICCTIFWTIDADASLERIRAYAQVMMTVWLVWELVESADDLLDLMRAYVAGSWVLAVLTLANFALQGTSGQVRFVAEGQDPNDVARFLVLALPMAALILHADRRRWQQALALGYLPVGLLSVLLTASRSGVLAACIALAGCGLLVRSHRRLLLAGLMGAPVLSAVFWFALPRGTIARLGTIPEQLAGGDLNQRLSIWAAGWKAFAEAPLFGSGAGTFVAAAGLARIDTAHNTALAVAVEGGAVALALALAVVAVAVDSVLRTRGSVRIALGTVLLVWLFTSLAATVEGNRSTWFLLALIAVAARLAIEEPTLSFRLEMRAPPAGAGSIPEPSA